VRTLQTFALIAFVAASVAACRRTSGPSLEFVEASGLHDRLVLNQGDAAYSDPQMGQVETLLKQVPQDSPDSPAAQELLAKIAAERTRIEEEAAAAAAVQAEPPEPVFDEEDEEEEAAEAAAEPPDAGYSQPAVGMTLSEFQQKFSRCFQTGPQVMLSGVGMRDSWVMKDIANCRDSHPDFVGAMVLFDAGKVSGFARQSAGTLRLPDGGIPSGQRPPEPSPQVRPEAQQPGQPAQPSGSEGIKY